MRFVAFLCAAIVSAASFAADSDEKAGKLAVDQWAEREAKQEVLQLRLAQAVAEAKDAEPGPAEGPADQSATPAEPGQRPTIFDEIQIELLDLEQLGRDVDKIMQGESVRLTLDDCIALALENNHDIQIAGYDPLKANADLIAARGQFDPVMTGTLSWTDLRQAANPQTVAFGGVTQVESFTTDTELRLSGQMFWGTQYDARFHMEREEGTFSQFLAQYGARVSLTLTQPLLRGRGKKFVMARVRTAKNLEAIAHTQVELQVLTTIGEVVKAYWDLVGANDRLRVRQESLAVAESLVDITQRRLEIGVGSAIEVLSAQAGVAQRQNDLIAARTAIADAEDILKRSLAMRDGDYFSANRIVPMTAPASFTFDWDKQSSMDSAIENRPEIRGAALQIENAKIERSRARKNTLPQLDASVSWIEGGRDFNLNQALNGISRKQDDILTVNIIGSLPLGNRTARANYQRSRLTMEQAELTLVKLKDDVMMGVSIAGRSVLTSQALEQSSRQSRRLQEAHLRAEQARLELGTTTTQNVLDIEEDLIIAQVQELQSTINAEKALVDLQVAEGVLLNNLGIEFEMPKPEKPESTMEVMLDWDGSRLDEMFGNSDWESDDVMPAKDEAPDADAPPAEDAEIKVEDK